MSLRAAKKHMAAADAPVTPHYRTPHHFAAADAVVFPEGKHAAAAAAHGPPGAQIGNPAALVCKHVDAHSHAFLAPARLTAHRKCMPADPAALAAADQLGAA